MLSPQTQELNVLMYHSISDGDGPTCIPAPVFRMQLDQLADLGYQSVSLDEVANWLTRQAPLPPRPVLITFDDGFQDFTETAWPLLKSRGLGAVVFVPTGRVGGFDDWEVSTGHTARRLMSWEDVQRLGGDGVEFGGHSVHHEDLTRLPISRVRDEVETSRCVLEERLGGQIVAFAPPFGRSNAAIRAVIARAYQLSFGTMLGRATQKSEALELPRLEMHYFRNPIRWRTHLLGGGRWWLAARRSIRTLRAASYERIRSGVRVTSTSRVQP